MQHVQQVKRKKKASTRAFQSGGGLGTNLEPRDDDTGTRMHPSRPRIIASSRGSWVPGGFFPLNHTLWREQTRLVNEHILVLAKLSENDGDDASGMEQLPEASDGHVRPSSFQPPGNCMILKRCRCSILRRQRSLAAACKCRHPCKHQPILLIWGQVFFERFSNFRSLPALAAREISLVYLRKNPMATLQG